MVRAVDQQVRRLAFGVSLVALALPALSGCIAAAIPLAAGGAMFRSDAVSGKKSPEPNASVTVEVSKSKSQQATAPSGVVLTNLTALPVPSPADIAAGNTPRTDVHNFDAFYGYALEQASTDPLEAPMRSALLQNPGSLEPVRQNCGPLAPVVLVDLDPGDAVFDPTTRGVANDSLAQVLAVLRSKKVGVVWISAQDRAQEGAIRARLVSSGLDPQGSDRLLLPDPQHATKQSLRFSLAASQCPIALAGDSKPDFDELFAYLKNPDAAFSLDEMIGEGWFLTPNPFD